jgi:phosphoribosyl 1,2-cyclic phosphodiesterase
MSSFQTSVLASGSKGNAVLARTPRTSVLIDAGVSRKRILASLEAHGVRPSELQAILVSHEHGDHTYGIGALTRMLRIPVYITEPTYLACRKRLEPLPAGAIHFCPGDVFVIGDLAVSTFAASHDAIDGSHFVLNPFDQPERRLAVVTDAGYSTNLLIAKLTGVSTLVLESNHDLRMLMDGPYPWDVKQRIKGRHGHLSNEQAVGVLTKIIHPGLRNLVLAHLSEINNKPEVAEKAFRSYLDEIRHNVRLYLAAQDVATPLIEV